jgi:hypothetical protein
MPFYLLGIAVVDDGDNEDNPREKEATKTVTSCVA